MAYIPVLLNLNRKPENELIETPADHEISHLHLIKSIKQHDVAEDGDTEQIRNNKKGHSETGKKYSI